MGERRKAIRVAVVGAVVLAATVIAGSGASTSASAVHVIPPNPLEMRLRAAYGPARLSKTVPTPAVLHLSGEFSTSDGSHPPALEKLEVAADRDLGIDVRGLPSCRWLRVPDLPPIYETCKDAVVGRGAVGFQVDLLEEREVAANARATVYNGGASHGVITLYLVTRINVPVPAAVVIPIEIKDVHEGPFRTEIEVSVPKIAGGTGSITRFKLRLARRIADRGRIASLVSMTCSGGRVDLHARATFRDGLTVSEDFSHPCTAQD